MPNPVPIGEPSGITAVATGVLQPAGQHRIVGGVGQYHEPVVDQLLGGAHQFDGIGQ
jgi:hypothetical protein